MNSRVVYYLLILLVAPSFYVAAQHFEDSKLTGTVVVSILAYFITLYIIPKSIPSHIRRGLFGRDINKVGDSKIPESMGLQSSFAYLLCLIVITSFSDVKYDLYPAVISVIITTLLGFADDVLDIPWRVKIVIPLFTVLPLVINYSGSTTICFHGFLSPAKSLFHVECIDIGALYYVYIVLLSVFCTHSINIYAGINGLEAGQSFVVASCLLFHSLYYWDSEPQSKAAVSILLPFLMATFALLHFNWFPSKVFVGDTFTLTAGATIAAAGILGHFAEMTLLFMMPQLINFVLSIPQLIGIVPCPRHRLPKLNEKTGKLEGIKTNLNVVNWWLIIFGPKTEGRLCVELIFFQIVCCIGAYGIKYLYNNSLLP